MMSSKKPFYVYFVPKTHHDLGYTHTIDKLFEVYCDYYDSVLDYCDKTENYPYEAQYRYTVESFWSLDYYLKHTSDKNRERMKKYVQNKRIEIQAFYANVIDGICSEEEIARLIYPSAAYAKECGVKLTSAALTDIPGMSAGLIKAHTNADIKYLFAGFPTYFEWPDHDGNPLPQTKSFWDEEKLFGWGHPAAFNWKAKNGKKVLSWYQYGYGYMGKDSEPLFEADDYEMLESNLPAYVADLQKNTPYAVMRYVDHGMDNSVPSMAVCDAVAKWNACHEDIKCIVATETMFFEALEKDCATTDIPEVFGEMPHTDYTTCALSEAGMTAINTRAKERLLLLENFDTLKQLNETGEKITSQINSIYNDSILYDEHCFGMANYGSRYEYNRSIKMNYAFRASWHSDKLWQENIENPNFEEDLKNTLFCGAGVKGASVSTFVQCNTQNQKDDRGMYIYKDEQGRPIYVQYEPIKDTYLPIPGIVEKYVLKRPSDSLSQYIVAVPNTDTLSLSSLEFVSKERSECSENCNDLFFENQFYRIDFDADKGGAYRVFDKELGRYITDESYSLGEVAVRDIETNEIHIPKVTKMYHRLSGKLADSMVICSTAPTIPEIVTEITLHHIIKRIDVSVRLVLDRTPFREAFSLFPFAVEKPEFSFQGIGSPLKAFDDIVDGANTNQYTAQHWCKSAGINGECVLAMSEGRVVEFGDINTTAVSQAHRLLSPNGFDKPYITKDDISNGHIVSMLSYNNCRTNFAPLQQGEVIYRYAITSGNNVDADAFAENFIYPAMILPMQMTSCSVELGAENLNITSFKCAEDNDGYIMRIKENKGVKTNFTLNISGYELSSVKKCTLTEEDICSVDSCELSIEPYETLTLRIK